MTLTTQFITMLAMVGMGAFFGASLDTYNRFLKRTQRKDWLVFVNDILFWFMQGLVLFYILFFVNQGEIRLYIFLALLCGFAAYQSLFRRIYLYILEKVISAVISIYHFLVKTYLILIYRPIYALILGIITVTISISKGLLALLNFIVKVLIWVLKVISTPVRWIFLLLWNFLPKKIKKYVEKLYNKKAGYFMLIKKYFSKWKKR